MNGVVDTTPSFVEGTLPKVDFEKQEMQIEIERLKDENTELRRELDHIKQRKDMQMNLGTAHANEMQNNGNSDDIFTITFYTNGFESTQKQVGEEGYGITASGEPTKEGITAACPKEMSFGTKVEIEGVGTRTCLDRGGGVNGKHIDVFVESVEKARQLGRQQRKVKILN